MQFTHCKIAGDQSPAKGLKMRVPRRCQAHVSPAAQSLPEIHAEPFLQGILLSSFNVSEKAQDA